MTARQGQQQHETRCRLKARRGGSRGRYRKKSWSWRGLSIQSSPVCVDVSTKTTRCDGTDARVVSPHTPMINIDKQRPPNELPFVHLPLGPSRDADLLGQIGKLLGDKWKQMSDAEKKVCLQL